VFSFEWSFKAAEVQSGKEKMVAGCWAVSTDSKNFSLQNWCGMEVKGYKVVEN